MDAPVRFQKEVISNRDYVISPVADAKQTAPLERAILAFRVVAVQFAGR